MLRPKDPAGWLEGRRRLVERFREPSAQSRAADSAALSACLLEHVSPEWDLSKGPLRLDQPEFFVSGSGGCWKGPEDLSAEFSIVEREGKVILDVAVRDDHWVPFDGKTGGDYLTLRMGYMRADFGVDATGRLVLNAAGKSQFTSRITQFAGRTEAGRWHFRIHHNEPGHLFRSEKGKRLAWTAIVFHEDDGAGRKGRLSWGTWSGPGRLYPRTDR
jgi:hypothetical protein